MDAAMLITNLKAAHAEELADMKKYNEWADALEADHPEYSPIFRDIAKEEEIHAMHIACILNELNGGV